MGCEDSKKRLRKGELRSENPVKKWEWERGEWKRLGGEEWRGIRREGREGREGEGRGLKGEVGGERDIEGRRGV